MQHAFALIYMWMAARADENVVYGPRFAIYTAIVQLPDGRPALDVGASVREDTSVIDRLCRLPCPVTFKISRLYPFGLIYDLNLDRPTMRLA